MKMALGRGLDALIPDKGLQVLSLDIKKIIPNSKQPRKHFQDESLNELALSIKERGIIQPILVSKNKDGSYSIIAGERRWRAASLAGLKKIPAILKEADDRSTLELALIENIQREDLNPLEMANAFEHLMTTYKLTQEELSEKIGKERATIANYLRLLKLPEEIKNYLNNNKLSMGHARAILSIDDRKKQIDLAHAIVNDGLNVRTVEAIVKEKKASAPRKKTAPVDPNIKDIEDRLRQSLGTKVQIKNKGKKGRIEIEYYSLEELDRLLDVLL